jgi:hypothetical protein
MPNFANRAVILWDGLSRGTRNMLENMRTKLRHPVSLKLIHIPKEDDDGW